MIAEHLLQLNLNDNLNAKQSSLVTKHFSRRIQMELALVVVFKLQQ